MEKIISGGQTGVDRAALDIAINFGIAWGGKCPKGRLAEDGKIPDCYNLLEETDSSEYSVRTSKNVEESDGTLVIVCGGDIGSGTEFTIKEARRFDKPHFIFDLACDKNTDKIKSWISENRIRILNIAGPRESQVPGGIYFRSYEFLYDLFSKKSSNMQRSHELTL